MHQIVRQDSGIARRRRRRTGVAPMFVALFRAERGAGAVTNDLIADAEMPHEAAIVAFIVASVEERVTPFTPAIGTATPVSVDEELSVDTPIPNLGTTTAKQHLPRQILSRTAQYGDRHYVMLRDVIFI